jgi:ADP-ribosylglycohydrolase
VEQGPDDSAADGADDATDDLAIFVERLAAAGSDDATAKAREQIRRTIAATTAPPGLRHLAEALAATLADTPAPRKPAEDAATVGAAMRVSPLLILQDHSPAAVADAVATLVGDGRRVLVTAATTDELGAVRAALRPDVA